MQNSPAAATYATTAPPPQYPQPSITDELGITSPLDAGLVGVLAVIVWKQSQIVAVLKHTDEVQTATLASLKAVVKSLQNIVQSHDRRIDRLEGKRTERRKIEQSELDTNFDDTNY